MRFALRAARRTTFRPCQPFIDLAGVSQCAAAHDEGQHYPDGDNRNDRKYDAHDYEHPEPPKFSHLQSPRLTTDSTRWVFQ